MYTRQHTYSKSAWSRLLSNQLVGRVKIATVGTIDQAVFGTWVQILSTMFPKRCLQYGVLTNAVKGCQMLVFLGPLPRQLPLALPFAANRCCCSLVMLPL